MQNYFFFFLLDLDQCLDKCLAYAKKLTPQTKNWSSRMEDLGKSWAKKRPEILKPLLEMESLSPSSLCLQCKMD